MKDRMNLIIKRSIWLRGEEFDSFLLRARDQKQCCLGILAEACGIPRDDLLQVAKPQVLRFISEKDIPQFFRWTIISQDSLLTMLINDNSRLLEHEREEKITQIFAKNGIDVIFED